MRVKEAAELRRNCRFIKAPAIIKLNHAVNFGPTPKRIFVDKIEIRRAGDREGSGESHVLDFH
jgi:hypothetical protein